MSANKLHSGLVDDGNYSKSFPDFFNDYSRPEKQKKLHDGLVKDGEYSGDFNSFQNQYFSKTGPNLEVKPAEIEDVLNPTGVLNEKSETWAGKSKEGEDYSVDSKSGEWKIGDKVVLESNVPQDVKDGYQEFLTKTSVDPSELETSQNIALYSPNDNDIKKINKDVHESFKLLNKYKIQQTRDIVKAKEDKYLLENDGTSFEGYPAFGYGSQIVDMTGEGGRGTAQENKLNLSYDDGGRVNFLANEEYELRKEKKKKREDLATNIEKNEANKYLKRAKSVIEKAIKDGDLTTKDLGEVDEFGISDYQRGVATSMMKEDLQQKLMMSKMEENLSSKQKGIIKTDDSREQLKKLKQYTENLDKKQTTNLELIDFTKNQIDINDKKRNTFLDNWNKNINPLELEYKNLSEKLENLGPLNENSLDWLKNKYNSINEQRNGVINKINNFKEDNKESINNYEQLTKDRNEYAKLYKNASLRNIEYDDDAKKAMLYHNALNKNYNLLASSRVWLGNSLIDLAEGVAGVKYAINDVVGEGFFGLYGNDLKKMPPIVRLMRLQRDVERNLYLRGKTELDKWQNDWSNTVATPVQFEDLNWEDPGDIGNFVTYTLANFAPQLALIYFTGGSNVALSTLAASAGGNKYTEMSKSNFLGNSDYTLAEKWGNSATHAFSEYFSEKITFGIGKGYFKKFNQATKKRVKDGFLKQLYGGFTFKGGMKGAYNMNKEGLSEVFAGIGQNWGDNFWEGKNIPLSKGWKGNYVSGLIMERAMATPLLYKNISDMFMGNGFQGSLYSLNKTQQEYTKILENKNLSPKIREKTENLWLQTEAKKEEIMAQNIDNLDIMTTKEKQDLIDINNETFDLAKEQDDINADKTLNKNQKETLINQLKTEESKLLNKKQEILKPYEEETTRKKKVDQYQELQKTVKEKVDKYNKRQEKKGKDATSKVVEFKTKEEQQAFFNNEISELNAKDQAEIVDNRKLLKENSNINRQDQATIKKNIDLLNNQIKNRNQESKSRSSTYGFIKQQDDGSFEVYLNKENALAEKGNINVAAHEFLHATLYKTIKQNTVIQDKLGSALQSYIENKKGGFSQAFINAIQPYLGQENVGEEMITVMSESIMNGSLKFNDGFFTKVGDLVRQNLQKLGVLNIKFNTGKDVYNLIKDYNASIEKNYDSKAIDRLMDTGAKGKLVDGAVKIDTKTQYSTSAFQNQQVIEDLGLSEETKSVVRRNKEIVDKILAEGLKDNKGDTKASPKYQQQLVLNNMGRSWALARQASGKANDLTLQDGLKMNDAAEWFSEYNTKLVELANSYRAEKDGKKVPFGAYMNTLLPLKYSGILDKLKSKVETSSMSDEATAKKVAKKQAPKKDDGKKELEGTAVALEQMGHGDVMPKLQSIYNVNKNKVKSLKTYKDVKNAIYKAKKEGPFYQGLVEVAEIFTNENFTAEELAKRILNKQDLTKEMRKAVQDKILKHSPEMITMVPDGTTVGGDATGIANTKLGVWYNKQGRSKFSDTGTGKGLPVQQKQGLNTQTFLNPFGLGEKGKRVTDKSVDGALREWVMQITTLAMNQAGRKADPQNITLLKTKEGKSTFQFSTAVVNDLFQVNSLFELEYNGKDKLLNFYKLPKTLKINNVDDIPAFINMLKRDVFPLLPKEAFFGPGKGTAFTKTSSIFGLESLKDPKTGKSIKVRNPKTGKLKSVPDPLWVEIQSAIQALKNDNSIVYGDRIPGVKPSEMWSLRTQYDNLFESPQVIETNIENGEIANFNKQVAAIHKVLWTRIKDSIKDTKGASATGIATYLGVVANDTGHWHKLGAQFAGYSKKITGKRYEYEHAMPATAAYLYLLDAALTSVTDGVSFESAYDLVIDNYKLIALDKAMDNKLVNARTKRGYSLQRRMPDNWDLIKDRWLDRYFNDIVMAQDGGINPESIIALNGKTFAEEYGISFSKVPEFANFDKNNTIQKAIQFSKNTRNPAKGITVLDFDDTLATTKSLVKYTTQDGKVGTLNAEQFANTYQDLLEKGYKFDFSDFNKVVKGKLAPLFQKALKLQNKFGPKNMFVLTARPPAAQQAIFDFLNANGLNIPIENITGLANSTSEAKALWIADKVGKGYNDFYFADDALQNVQAVKNMLDQFDVKSKVQQAKIQFSKNMDDIMNDIIEQNTGIEKEKRFSSAEGRARGIGKGKYKVWIPAGAEDFMGLMYTIANAKGKKGDAQLDFFKKALLEPYNNGVSSLNNSKQELSGNYKALLKQHPKIKKLLNKKLEETSFTYDHAVRVYLWDKAGFETPGIAETTKQKLIDAVESFNELKGFADSLGKITKIKEGYPQPNPDWVAESIIADLAKATDEVGRSEFLKEFKNNVDVIFSLENLNKIEAIYGKDYRDALENMLFRMKTGKNKSTGVADAQVNRWTTWVTNSIGAIMFLNMRSAVLQTISSINFVNWSDNNPVKAAAAFANQKQFWKDFLTIFNSPYLKQRRSGLKTDVNEAQLANALAGKKNKVSAALAYLLKLGFTPTQIADSFAISSGGATFYRNRVKSLMKDGMSKENAEKQAFADMQEIANVSQQSSDPSLISKQQASILGRFILAFQNTPMQYARLTKKAAIDLIKGRGDWKSNVSKIVYYTFIQNLIFNAMQQALFAGLFDDEEDEKLLEKKEGRLLNGMVDSVLRGTGIYGAVVATAKNIALEFWKQDQKEGRADHAYTMLQFANISPPIGSKMRKLYSATQTRKFNRGAMEQMGYDIYNPAVPAIATGIEAFTNLPTGRLYQKFNNISEAFNEENENWQRVALMMGWNTWDLGVKQSFKVNKSGKKTGKSKFGRGGFGGKKTKSKFGKGGFNK